MLAATEKPMNLAKFGQINAVDNLCCRPFLVKVKIPKPFAWRCTAIILLFKGSLVCCCEDGVNWSWCWAFGLDDNCCTNDSILVSAFVLD